MDMDTDTSTNTAPQGADPQNLTDLPTGITFDDDDAPEAAPEAAQPAAPPAQAPAAQPGAEDDDDPDLTKVRAEFTPEQQAKFDAAIARKIAKHRARERELQMQIQQIQQQAQTQQQGEDREPAIPPVPDVWAPDYDARLAARDKAIEDRAAWNLRRQVAEYNAQASQDAQMQQARAAMTDAVSAYRERAVKQGVDPGELARAGQLVNALGVDMQLQLYILGEETGPSITTYLARNPQEIDRINQMSPVQAAAYIAAAVAPKAVQTVAPVTAGDADEEEDTPPPQIRRTASVGQKRAGGIVYE
jgi:hypothetical protein